MCGLVAVLGAPALAARLERGLDAIAHRGPDGRGVWRDAQVALGHVRLAVLAPDDGAQPVHSEDGAIVAIVNGELYDHVAVARELRARGHDVRSRGDAELLVHLYEDEGDDFVGGLRGELAFVLWDARRRRLLAGRDRFGVKPLVWARVDGGVALASEAKALFALGLPARWDDESFFHAAHTQYVWPDRTLFAGVHQVEPGHVLVVEDGEVRTRAWGRRACEVRSIRDALDDAVRVRTVADAPVAVQLSGGLDSTAVLALAARARPDVRAFTVGFDGAGYDERAQAETTARALGVALEIVPIDARAIADLWPRAVAHGEGLAVNGHLAAKWALSRAMQRAGYKVALTGEGADELFAGYPHLRRDAGVDDAAHAPSRGVMLPHGDGLPLDLVRARLGFVPTWLAAKATLGRRVRTLLARDLVAQFAGEDPYLALIERARVPDDGPPVRRAAHAWIASALAQYILRTLGDAMEMAHGIEGRVPFLDPSVVQAASTAQLVDPRIDKPALRDALDGIVPDQVRARAKHAFLAPPLGVAAPALVQDLLRTHAARTAWIDRARLLDLLDRLPHLSPDEQQAWDPALMLLLSAAVIAETYT